MIYDLSLQTTGLAAGVLLLVSHTAGLINVDAAIKWAKALPRSRAAATLLLLIAAVWGFLLTSSIDLGEFSPLRRLMLVGIAVGAVLSWMYVEEFLAVRSLGMLLLLAAEPLLESAVLRDEPSRLLLTVLAYGWVLAGLFCVGMPYLLRDAIEWVSTTTTRWRLACLGGIAYAIALIACALLFW